MALISGILTTLTGFFAGQIGNKWAKLAAWMAFFSALYALLLAAKSALITGLTFTTLFADLAPAMSCIIPGNALPCLSAVLTANACVSGYNYLRNMGKPLGY